DPTLVDTQLDIDLDGVPAIEEVRTGTHPAEFEADDLRVERIRTRVEERPVTPPSDTGEPVETPEGTCYDFQFENLRLTTTVGEGENKGRNRVFVYAHEAPAGLSGGRGRIWVSCVEARYLGEQFKNPPSGAIGPIHPNRFVEIGLFDADTHCLEVGEDPSVAPAWAP
ncbi:MAG: hypothetical protein AAF602_18035, partial [Myxococcota bacterium]